MYSEHYLLTAILLFADDKFDMLMPGSHVSWYTDFLDPLNPLWKQPGLEKLQRPGGFFSEVSRALLRSWLFRFEKPFVITTNYDRSTNWQ